MNMIRNALLVFGLVGLSVTGCNWPGGSTMTKDELYALKNPSKTIPKAALEGMSHMGEMMEKQRQANAAAGVDSRGVPLSKSKEKMEIHRAPSPGK